MAKSTIMLALGLGMIAGTLRPAFYSNATHSFANWLSSILIEEQAGKVIEELKAIHHLEENLYQMISRASVLVSRHNQAFSLPLPEGDYPRETSAIFQLLIAQWNTSETQNAMGEVPVREWIKSVQLIFYDKIIETPGELHSHFFTSSTLVSNYLNPFVTFGYRWITPFVSGTAIGAP